MISLVLPTLGKREKELDRLILSLNKQIFKEFELIVISQDNHDIIENNLHKANFFFKQIKIEKKGLSAARNIGIQHISGNIITFTDDDCWYHEDSLYKVNSYFKNSDEDILIFQHIDPTTNSFPKKYKNKHKSKLSSIELLSHASIDIFINTDTVKTYSIGFDENFGLGAKYNSGEENIYLMDLNKKGYRTGYYPIIISYHLNKPSKMLYNDNYFITKYNIFIRMFGKWKGYTLFLIFILKNRIKFNLSIKKIIKIIRIRKSFTY